MSPDEKSYLITLEGLVQSVGFRPFIYKKACLHNLKGYVKNTPECVVVHVEGNENDIQRFLQDITTHLPPNAHISSIKKEEVPFHYFASFNIIESSDASNRVTEISPDISVCDECLKDMENQPHRISYPFINCTSCGPRFSIIRALPYDRKNTTMAVFNMCDQCKTEYDDVNNRRFHAQPIGCNHCGPRYLYTSKEQRLEKFEDLLEQTAKDLLAGKLIAIKGLGGYNLVCLASCEESVQRLRTIKGREGKPFAVMFRDLSQLEEYAFLTEKERELIRSWRKPILILKQKKALAPSVSNGLNTTGCLLPYLPFHYLLFKKVPHPLVYTSGNLSDEPIVTDNEIAFNVLLPVVDAVVSHNRDIYNRLDDSVACVIDNTARTIRRARGYAPASIAVNLPTEGIFAAGAELTNCFAIGKDTRVILSQHIGDLKNYETYQFYTESIEKYKTLFRFTPSLMACDLHPDYLSTRYATEASLPVEPIQHHHAHLAACMAEYKLNEPVIGVCFDGTGLGDDHCLWGGEFLVCTLTGYTRHYHLEYTPLPGGDRAIEEPWRTAVAYLFQAFEEETIIKNIFHSCHDIGKNIPVVIDMIKKKINSPLSSGAGRLFDAVAAITGTCLHASFHAEAPMRLESLINTSCEDEYPFSFQHNTIHTREMLREIAHDVLHHVPVPEIAAKFHNTLVSIIFAVVYKIKQETGLRKTVLSGGVFQNRYLTERTATLLRQKGFEVFIPSEVPCNDGGIALGQMVIAAARRNKK